jgi:hypothetical protein
MKKIIPAFLLILIAVTAHTQVISKFTWNSSVLTATTGPNATSAGSSVVISSGGVGGTNGLNPGSPATNINLIIPGSPTFNVQGIDIAVDFRREESDASFFTRGANFDFGMLGGKLFAKFLVSNGSGGSTTINSGSIYSIANDHTFHNYHFKYDATNGVTILAVDGTTVYTSTGTVNRPMYWTGAGNVSIGYNADATGNNVAIFDNLVIQNVPNNTILPVTLLSFSAEAKNSFVVTNWSTTNEIGFAGFTLERSADGVNFTAIETVKAVNTYTSVNNYEAKDISPLSSLNYYRLKMTDIDGHVNYSLIRTVSFSGNSTEFNCYPNPTIDQVTIRINNNSKSVYRYMVTTIDGKTILYNTVQLETGSQLIHIDLSRTINHGILMIELESKENNVHQYFKIVKQ